LAGEVVVEHGRITSVGPVPNRAEGQAPLGDAEVVELGDRRLVPGYIDAHVHGGGGAQCNSSQPQEITEAALFHARHGTTGFVATTVPATVDDLIRSLAAINRSTAPNLLGVHLEGPFLSRERPGALDPGLFLDPDLAQLDRLLEAGAGTIRVMTLAPELPGALGLVERLGSAGIVASVGHTNASDKQVRAAVRAGASAATHVFNAMGPLHHRAPGAPGAVLDLDQVSCELICDGLHVDPVVMRLFYRAKGGPGVRLVTDAIAAAGMPDGEYKMGGRPIRVTAGRAVLAPGESLAGSTLTMEAAVQNAVRFLGISIEDAVPISSTNAARLLGLGRRKGAIAPGLDADLLVLDDRLAVEATMISGRWVAGRPKESL
jgi:N-acetylglucosamine-6-phosphate deacetylase